MRENIEVPKNDRKLSVTICEDFNRRETYRREKMGKLKQKKKKKQAANKCGKKESRTVTEKKRYHVQN